MGSTEAPIAFACRLAYQRRVHTADARNTTSFTMQWHAQCCVSLTWRRSPTVGSKSCRMMSRCACDGGQSDCGTASHLPPHDDNTSQTKGQVWCAHTHFTATIPPTGSQEPGMCTQIKHIPRKHVTDRFSSLLLQ